MMATDEIAKKLGVSEASVANSIEEIKDLAKKTHLLPLSLRKHR
jgi:biotin operon repressor